jgi:hypothetical protein
LLLNISKIKGYRFCLFLRFGTVPTVWYILFFMRSLCMNLSFLNYCWHSFTRITTSCFLNLFVILSRSLLLSLLFLYMYSWLSVSQFKRIHLLFSICIATGQNGCNNSRLQLINLDLTSILEIYRQLLLYTKFLFKVG